MIGNMSAFAMPCKTPCIYFSKAKVRQEFVADLRDEELPEVGGERRAQHATEPEQSSKSEERLYKSSDKPLNTTRNSVHHVSTTNPRSIEAEQA